jgi:SCP-2 sterol transfer family
MTVGEAGGEKASESKGESAPWLAGMSGRLRLDVAGQPVRVLDIHEGVVTPSAASGAEPCNAVISCASEELVVAFNRGELNPVVAMLQGRMTIEGDRAFALQAILGLQPLRRPPPASARAVDPGDQAAQRR